MKNSVENLIRECANNRIASKYNLTQYKKEGSKLYKERERAILHKSVCEQIVAFVETHPQLGFCFVIACGVQKDAHKTSAFLKGYKRFDAEKVETVATMGMLYNEYNGLKGKKMSDVTWRLITRYYDQVSHNVEDFIKDLNNSKVLGRKCGERGNYNALCENLNIPIVVKGKELSDADREKIFGKTA